MYIEEKTFIINKDIISLTLNYNGFIMCVGPTQVGGHVYVCVCVCLCAYILI